METIDLYQAHAWDLVTPLEESLRFFDDAVCDRRDQTPTASSRLGDDPGRGMETYAPRNAQERTWRIIDAVRQVAEGRAVSMSQVALAWLVDRPAVTSVILRDLGQRDDNLAAAGLHLSEGETALLDKVSAPEVADYPYGGPGVDQRSRRF